MARTNIEDINDGELPSTLSGLGQTSTGKVFDDGPGTVMTLSQGVKSPRQVRQMQMLLNQYGYMLAADGVFGAGTAAAVKIVQLKLSMAVTGVYDKALDARIVGMNQSGIIDATQQAVQLIHAAESMRQTTGGLLPPPKAGTGMTVEPVKDITGQNIGQTVKTGDMTIAGQSFMEKVKAKLDTFMADPNFKFYAAGAAVLAVGGLMFVGGIKNPAAAQVNGYYRPYRPMKRKSRKSRS